MVWSPLLGRKEIRGPLTDWFFFSCGGGTGYDDVLVAERVGCGVGAIIDSYDLSRNMIQILA